MEEWDGYVGELTGLDPTFVQSEAAIEGVRCDTSLLAELLGDVPITTVEWRDGIRRMVETKAPEALVSP